MSSAADIVARLYPASSFDCCRYESYTYRSQILHTRKTITRQESKSYLPRVYDTTVEFVASCGVLPHSSPVLTSFSHKCPGTIPQHRNTKVVHVRHLHHVDSHMDTANRLDMLERLYSSDSVGDSSTAWTRHKSPAPGHLQLGGAFSALCSSIYAAKKPVLHMRAKRGDKPFPSRSRFW